MEEERGSKIKALFIFEILGKPAGHVKEALHGFLDKLGEQKGVEIVSKKIHEPKLVKRKGEEEKSEENEEGEEGGGTAEGAVKQEIKKTEDLFTTFGEVELFADNLNLIFAITLAMLPSHVEILEPADLKIKNFDLSSALSALTEKLHRYDEIAKSIIIERKSLLGKLKELQDKLDNFEGEKKTNEKTDEKTEKKTNEKTGEDN